ncbi:phage tail tape measure protein, partial [bacterium]|nr:phage tail tape measure protein [bacterium]
LLTMFGNIRGATAMLSLTGSIDKYHQFRTQMNEENSKGVLEKQANIMLSAPQQQFKILKQNFTDSLRLFGEKLMPKVNELLGHATNMLNKLNSMSDEQISQIVDNVIKVAAFGATLIAIGTACKALASILSLVNLIWGGVSKLAGIKLVGDALKGAGGAAAGAGAAKAAGGAGLFGKVGAGLSAAGGKLLAGASAAGKFLLGKALPAVIGFKIGMDLSETKIGNDSLFKEGEPIYYYDNVDDMRAQMRPEVRERFELMDKLQKENNEKRKQQELENQNKPAYQTYDPKTNKFTNVYISNVDVNGVENLDNMISEIENAADSMR